MNLLGWKFHVLLGDTSCVAAKISTKFEDEI
jgi:hypothetical protein